jgi:hypothetical protein
MHLINWSNIKWMQPINGFQAWFFLLQGISILQTICYLVKN